MSRVRERRAVAGLSVFQVSRVTKGRSRRSSQNENRTNEHHLIIYLVLRIPLSTKNTTVSTQTTRP